MADLGRASAVPNVGMAVLGRKGATSANLQGARRLLGRSAMAQIESIYRYPVKGFSPERLPQVTLTKGATLPLDRAYAVENGPSKFDPAKAAIFSQNPLPGADAQRPAGGTAYRVGRRDPRDDDPLRKPRGRARRSADP